MPFTLGVVMRDIFCTRYLRAVGRTRQDFHGENYPLTPMSRGGSITNSCKEASIASLLRKTDLMIE